MEAHAWDFLQTYFKTHKNIWTPLTNNYYVCKYGHLMFWKCLEIRIPAFLKIQNRKIKNNKEHKQTMSMGR